MTADDARQRFLRATERHLSAPLTEGVTLRHVDFPSWDRETDPIWQAQGRPGLDVRMGFTPDERTGMGDLDAVLHARLAHHVLVEAQGQVIGGYWGLQETEARYMMVVSVFRPEFQGRGLYSRLLPRVVAAARDAGFREVFSRHRADNNAILVAKLKAGFVIGAFEIAPRWGLTVHLRKYLFSTLAEAHDYRVDGTSADKLRARGLPVP